VIYRLKDDSSLVNRTSLTLEDIRELLSFCLRSTDFVFRNKFYNQRFGCPMGSPLSVVLANLVMEDIERRIFGSPDNFDVRHYYRFVDDTWVVLPESNVHSFFNHINRIESSISFTMELEDPQKSIAFLDVLVTRCDDGSFSSAVFRKATHTDRYLSFNSHHPKCHKRSVVRTLSKRATDISSSKSLATQEENKVAEALSSNGYPRAFISRNAIKCDPPISQSSVCHGVVVLPYVRGVSESIKKCLSRKNVKTYFKPRNKLSSFFKLPKDPFSKVQKCGVVYKIKCRDCHKAYIGQTKNSLGTRVNQHRSAFRNFHVEKSALAEHAVEFGHRIDWDNPEILSCQNVFAKRLFIEAWMSMKHGTMNRCELPIPSQYTSLVS